MDHRRAGRVHDLHRRDLYPLDLPRHSAILPYGVGMDLPVAYACGGIITVILAAWVMRRGTAMQSIKVEDL
ncbi:MAG: hypothetical protein V8T87_15050 [Victivallales bacterium]